MEEIRQVVVVNFLDDLADDLLLQIFNYFNGKSLKVLALVCKRWCQLIGESASTMKYLPLNFTRYSKDSGELLRKYHSIQIENLQEDSDLSCFPALGESIQCLEITYSTFTNIETLKFIFNSFKLLNQVKLVQVKLECEVNNEPRNISPMTLKRLEFVQVDHRLLNYLPSVQVLILEVIDANNKTDVESLVKFLDFQKKLNMLTIENLSEGSSLFEAVELKTFNFKLNTLSILFSHVRDVEKFEINFISFLEGNAESLKKLKIEGSLTNVILKNVITKLKKIEELEMNLSELPKESSFYDLLDTNRSLKVLKLNGTINRSNFYGFNGILSRYKNIENISLADTDKFVANDVFQVLSSQLTRLSHLSVLNLHESFASQIIIQSLKTFSIRILNKVDQWKHFIKANESLESLNVGWIQRDQFTAEIISEITELPNLRHLKFGGRFIATKRIYEVIKRDYKRVQVLELMVANYDEIKNLKFIFPRDKSQWRPQCEYFDEGSDREPLND